MKEPKRIGQTFAEYLVVPSAAIRAMCDGLEQTRDMPGFTVNMGTFGQYNASSQTCFGCAAVCAVQNVLQRALTPDEVVYRYRRAFGLASDLSLFENSMDEMRLAKPSRMLEYFKVANPEPLLETLEALVLPCMLDAGLEPRGGTYLMEWPQAVPLYRVAADKLEALGY